MLLLLGESSSHGYGLARRLRGYGVDIGAVSMVYGALRRLENAGMVRSSLHLPLNGPAQKVYQLTEMGLTARNEWIASFSSMQAWLVSQESTMA